MSCRCARLSHSAKLQNWTSRGVAARCFHQGASVRHGRKRVKRRPQEVNVVVHHPQPDHGPGGPKWFWEDFRWLSREWMMTRDPANNAMHLFSILVNVTGLCGLGLAFISYSHSQKSAKTRWEDDQFDRDIRFVHYAEARIDDHGLVLDDMICYFRSLQEEQPRKWLLSKPASRFHHADGTVFLRWNRLQVAGREKLARRSGIPMEDPVAAALVDIWFELKLHGDNNARIVDRERRKMKNFFTIAHRAWKQNPTERHQTELVTYLQDAWSHQRVRQFLELVLPMDKAVARHHKVDNWRNIKPAFYDLIENVWGLRETDTSASNLNLVQIEAVGDWYDVAQARQGHEEDRLNSRNSKISSFMEWVVGPFEALRTSYPEFRGPASHWISQ